MKILPMFVSFVVIPGLISCAGSGEKKPLKSQASRSSGGMGAAKCPRSECITATGLSSRGMNEAEADAKRKIAEQIQSEIKSEMLVRRQEVESDASNRFSSELLSNVESRSVFAHAELIQLESAFGWVEEGIYHVSAWLRRDLLAGVLSAEAGRVIPSLSSSQAEALGSNNLLAFNRPAMAADKEFKSLLATETQYHAVTHEDLPRFAELDSAQTAVAKHRQDLMLSTRIETRIITSESMNSYSGICQSKVAERLGAKGLEAGKVVKGCGSCLITEIHVDPSLDSNYRFGPMCKLNWEARVVDPETSSEAFLAKGSVAAYSSRGDMDDAIDKAWKKMADSASVKLVEQFQ